MEPGFIVNFDDPVDVRAKHREAVANLRQREQRLAELRGVEREIAKWRARVEFLASQLPDEQPPVGDRLASGTGRAAGEAQHEVSISDLVVGVVERELRKIRSLDVRNTLAAEGYVFTAEQVSNALYYAAHDAERIRGNVGRGMYAPLAYAEPEPAGPTATNGAMGGAQAQPAGAMTPRREDWKPPPATPFVQG